MADRSARVRVHRRGPFDNAVGTVHPDRRPPAEWEGADDLRWVVLDGEDGGTWWPENELELLDG